MKRKDFFKYIGSFSMAAAVGGCQDFLDVVPDNTATQKDAFKNKTNALNYLYSCYNFLPNNRDHKNSIALTTTDEIETVYSDTNTNQFSQGNYGSTNTIISNWGGFYQGIRHCYIFLNNVDTVPKLSAPQIKQYKAEANFLIGFYYFRLIRAYGPIPVYEDTPNISQSSDDFPTRSSLEDSITFTTNLLDKAAANLPEKQTGSDYGRATSVIAKAYKAKLLLHAASPLFNGGGENKSSLYNDFKDNKGNQLIPTTYDKSKWNKAADATKVAIDAAVSAGHELYHASASVGAPLPSDPAERDLRFTICDSDSSEILFPNTALEQFYGLQSDTKPFSSSGRCYNALAPTLSAVERFYTENGLPIDKDPDFDYENRYSIADGPNGKTMALNLNRSPRFNAWINYHNSYYEVKGQNSNELLCKFRKNDNCGVQGRTSDYSVTGYLNKKGAHPLSTNYDGGSNVNFPWPRLRLAELYLNYAEALIESGQKFSTAKNYIDKVRTRAGIPTVDVAWAPIGGADDKETLRSIVRRERANEFYFENQRFWYLRRWMTAKTYLNNNPKGMNIDGTTNEDFFTVTEEPYQRKFISPDHYLMPIPAAETVRNPKIIQNPGY